MRRVVEIDEHGNEKYHVCEPVHQGGPESIWLVKARYGSDNAQTVLVAFAKKEHAERHAERALACPWDDDGHPGMSPAMLLGIADVWVEELPVR